MTEKNIYPFVMKTTVEERKMLKDIQNTWGFATESAVIRRMIHREYMKLVEEGKIKEKSV